MILPLVTSTTVWPAFGIAVAGLGVRQRPDFVERVQVGARQAVRLALVEVAAQPDVPVGQGEQRFGLGQQVEVELGLADVPRLDGEGFVGDHDVQQLGEVGDHDVGAVAAQLLGLAHPVDADHEAEVAGTAGLARRKARPRTRRPRRRGRRAARAPRRYESGAGLPAMCSSRSVTPSTRCWTNRSRPVISSTSRVLALDDTTAIAEPGVRRPPPGSGATRRTP